ncbi:MAG: hypothetical protein ACRBFS_06525 [Aureispira sp.]
MAISEAQGERIRAFERKVLPKYPYWYGMKEALYKSVGLPPKQAASCHLQHGAVMMFHTQEPDHLTLNTPYPVIFLDNEEQVEFCKNYKAKPITKPMHIIGSIFPRYRRSQNIVQRPDAKGSLIFISHSTPVTKLNSNWKKLIEEYRQLPEQYHPLTFSIYYRDYLLGAHETFIEEGFDVVTAGHISDPRFVDNLYDTMSQFRYVAGNDIGSNLYYAVEMGIPFFLHGEEGKYEVTNYDASLKKSNKEVFKQSDYGRLEQIFRLFRPTAEVLEAGVEITPEQREFVLKMTGYHVALSDEEVKAIIQHTKWGFYAKEWLLSPLKFPLKLYRQLKVRMKKEIH